MYYFTCLRSRLLTDHRCIYKFALMTYLSRSTCLFLLTIAAASLSGQENFVMPTHQDGRVVAIEKFEMIEGFFERLVANAEMHDAESSPLSSKHNANGEVLISKQGKVESELHAIVDPNDPDHLVVAVMSYNIDNIFEALTISIYVTFDFGDTWLLSDFTGNELNRITLGGGDPLLAYDDKGKLYLSWLRVDVDQAISEGKWGIYLADSEDGGLSWNTNYEPIELNQFTDLLAFSDLEAAADKEWLVGDVNKESPYKGNLYMGYVMLGLASNEPTYDITMRRKLPNETAFDSMAIVISDSTHIISQFVTLEVDRKGQVHVTFLADEDENQNLYALYYSRSEDGGASYSSAKKVTEFVFSDFGTSDFSIPGISSNRAYPCPQMAVDMSGTDTDGTLYVSFTAFGLPTDSIAYTSASVYYLSTSDGGISWTEPQRFSELTDIDTDQFYNSLAVTEAGELVGGWYDRRTDSLGMETNYYLRQTDNDGISQEFSVSSLSTDFSTIGQLNNDFGIGEYNEILTVGEYTIPFWSDGRTADGRLAVYAYFYNKNGVSVEEKAVPLFQDLVITGLVPNPASGYFTLDFELQRGSTIQLSLYNVQGQSVLTEAHRYYASGVHQLTIDSSDLSAGTYLLQINTAHSYSTRKVIIK